MALTALKRLKPDRCLLVHEGTSDQLLRALEVVGMLFVEFDRGRGVCANGAGHNGRRPR
jgi:hypothetical protein